VAKDPVAIDLGQGKRRRQARVVVCEEASQATQDPRERESIGEGVDVRPASARVGMLTQEQQGSGGSAEKAAEGRKPLPESEQAQRILRGLAREINEAVEQVRAQESGQ
jgi:hypothetical protein